MHQEISLITAMYKSVKTSMTDHCECDALSIDNEDYTDVCCDFGISCVL